MYSPQQWLLLLLSFLITTVLAGPGNALEVCTSLFTYFPWQTYFPGSQQYEHSLSSYAFIGTRLRPTCIVGPKSTADVAAVIKIFGKFEDVAFAIRGGGHNTNKGFADIEDGITIDLSAMNTIQLSSATNTVSVGPGARWQSVYDAVDPYNLSIQGGRNGKVGVGGFLTGGGIGFYSPERGWACDSVKNFEVVLSNGTIVNANTTTNKDLFTALKGGQNNFGVVTRFDLKTFAQGKLWGGVILYSNSSDKELLDAFTAYKTPKNYDPKAMLTFGFVYDTAQRTFGADIAMYHAHPESVNGSTLEAFAKIQPQLLNSIRIGTPGSFAGEILSPIVKSYYMHWSTTTFAMSPTILNKIHASFRRNSLALTDNYASANLTIAYSLQSVPAAAPASDLNSLGFNPFSNPERNLVNIGIAFRYDDPTATDGLLIANENLATEFDKIAEADGVKDGHLYLNYAGSWQDVFAGYGSKNLEKMRRTAQKYDKVGMFQKQVKGGFKLFKYAEAIEFKTSTRVQKDSRETHM